MAKGAIRPLEQLGDRMAPRRRLQLEVRGSTDEGEIEAVLIHNVSETGLLIETEADLAAQDQLQVDLPEGDATTATVVWTSENLFGCKFEEPLAPAVLSAIRLQSPVDFASDETDFADEAEDSDDDAFDDIEEFHERLTRLRKERKLSRAELAKRAEVSEPSVWAWEIGKRQPRRRNIRALAASLDVSERELLLGMDAGPGKAEGAEGRSIELRPDVAPSTTLSELIASSKKLIADLAGTTSDKVRIVIEM